MPVTYGSGLASEVTVYIDGNPVTYEQSPVLEKGYVFVPMRAIFEQLGAEVEWIGEYDMLLAGKGDLELAYRIGERTAEINGETIPLNAAGKIVNGSTMMPIRFVAEALGASVKWDNEHEKTTLQM
jgi:hypothetical protein